MDKIIVTTPPPKPGEVNHPVRGRLKLTFVDEATQKILKEIVTEEVSSRKEG
jgi:hypothetical protein